MPLVWALNPGILIHLLYTLYVRPLLGGSWVVISRVISPLTWVTSIVTLLLTPLITTHEPPSRKV